MNIGRPKAISTSMVTVARMTLTPLLGRVMFTVVVDDDVDPCGRKIIRREVFAVDAF
jgi:hypothetical protein